MVVTMSTAYQVPGRSHGVSVAARATVEPKVAVRHRIGRVSSVVRSRAFAKTTSEYENPSPISSRVDRSRHRVGDRDQHAECRGAGDDARRPARSRTSRSRCTSAVIAVTMTGTRRTSLRRAKTRDEQEGAAQSEREGQLGRDPPFERQSGPHGGREQGEAAQPAGEAREPGRERPGRESRGAPDPDRGGGHSRCRARSRAGLDSDAHQPVGRQRETVRAIRKSASDAAAGSAASSDSERAPTSSGFRWIVPVCRTNATATSARAAAAGTQRELPLRPGSTWAASGRMPIVVTVRPPVIDAPRRRGLVARAETGHDRQTAEDRGDAEGPAGDAGRRLRQLRRRRSAMTTMNAAANCSTVAVTRSVFSSLSNRPLRRSGELVCRRARRTRRRGGRSSRPTSSRWRSRRRPA